MLYDIVWSNGRGGAYGDLQISETADTGSADKANIKVIQIFFGEFVIFLVLISWQLDGLNWYLQN